MYKSNYLAVADSETLGRWDDAVVLSFAVIIADLTKRYTLQQLVNERSVFIKLNIEEQIKRGRKKEKNVIDWWFGRDGKKNAPCEIAKKVSLYPDAEREIELDQFATELKIGCHKLGIDPRSVDWCDRNLFDLRKAQHIMEVTCGQYSSEPWDYHGVFDIVSWLRGVGVEDRYAGMKPWEIEGFIYHDPIHDAALDFLRVQWVLENHLGLKVGD